MDWNLVSFVTGSKLRFKLLIELNKSKKTPSELAHAAKTPMSHISSTLRDLEKRKLVICLTPERRKNKFYSITNLGKDVLEFISKEIDRKPTF